MNSLSWIADELAALEEKKLRRRLVARHRQQNARVTVDGRELINFGSNDYLSLAGDPRVGRAAAEVVVREGWGSGASPLITGYAESHQLLARRLAAFEGTEAALVFCSGFAANAGTIAALVGPGDAVYCDRKNHASIFDGCRLSRADVRIYAHTDCEQLAALLKESKRYRRRLIVTDGLFSMDGDLAPVPKLAELAERHEAMLLVDEAHATGVFGERGRGVCEYFGIEEHAVIRVGTLSKALGGIGGFVAGSQMLIDWLLNRARPYVFSTAAPPACSAASLAALDIVRDEPHRRTQLLARAAMLRSELRKHRWDIGPSVSQIIPVVVGDAERAMRLSEQLRERGLFVPAIRPPTVPEGEACLRISLTFGHDEEMISTLLSAISGCDG